MFLYEIETDEQRAAFIEGYESAGGFMGDLESDTPYCCPWDWERPDLALNARTPTEAGAAFWELIRGRVEEELEERRNNPE